MMPQKSLLLSSQSLNGREFPQNILKDIEEKRKEISEDLQKHKLCDDRLLYSGQLKGYNVLKNHIIQIKKNL
jgi:hypothetical protein